MGKARKTFIITLLLCLWIPVTGCSNREKNKTQTNTASNGADVPFYSRTSSVFTLLPDSNVYTTGFDTDGIFYYVMDTPEEEDMTDEWVPKYDFYYQPYDKSPVVSYGTVHDGIIRTITPVTGQNEKRLMVLQLTEEEAHLVELDSKGNVCDDMLLDSVFHDYEQTEELLAVDGGFVVSLKKEIFLLDDGGNIMKSSDVGYSVSELIGTDEETIYALGDDMSSDRYEPYVLLIDRSTLSMRDAVRLDDKVTNVFLFEDGLLAVYDNRIGFFHPGKDEVRTVIDLDKQDILSSEIVFLYGTFDAYQIVTLDKTTGCLLTLSEAAEDAESAAVDANYTADGRRIVHLAVNQDDITWNMTFHAKKYNKISEHAYIQVDVIDEPLEWYLGKGNRPDIVCFPWDSDMGPYIEKKALTNMLPLLDNQDTYSFDGIVPKAKELLLYDNGNAVYGISPYFSLLVRPTDGAEYDENGQCDIYEYLEWHEDYMAERDIYGVMDIPKFRYEYLLYASLDQFYCEEEATADFTADAFRKLMKTYKENSGHLKGEFDQYAVEEEYGSYVYEVARGPRWIMTYMGPYFTRRKAKLEGIPGTDGTNHVYMRLNTVLSIPETSDCKQEAFDFVMYFATLEEHLMKGLPEYYYGHNTDTVGLLSIWESGLNTEIFETTRFYGAIPITDDMKDQLRYLMDIAEPDTGVRRAIFEMMLEEMEPYLKGNKDLDSACEILNSKITLYLQERQ